MSDSLDSLISYLLFRLDQVRRHLGTEDSVTDPDTRFADAIDSMGMVEFLALVAEDCAVEPSAIERCTEHRFSTIRELARSMHAAGIQQTSSEPSRVSGRVLTSDSPDRSRGPARRDCWLAATSSRLPETVQSAATINEKLHRPPGWLESHAGIRQRRIWGDQSPLDAAADACRSCLSQTGLTAADVNAILVTSEAPPMLVGLGAALHDRIGLRQDAVALEIGGACTGFLAAVWTAQMILDRLDMTLVVAIEAHSHHLKIQPGPAGEAAALFGDGVAACLLSNRPVGSHSIPLSRVNLGTDGSAGRLLRVERAFDGAIEFQMDGKALAGRAIRSMAEATKNIARQAGLMPADLAGVVAHGGNGRMPALLARQLGISEDRVWSEVTTAGNLGSASLPVAWAAHQHGGDGPVAWVAVGAGLSWGACLSGHASIRELL